MFKVPRNKKCKWCGIVDCPLGIPFYIQVFEGSRPPLSNKALCILLVCEGCIWSDAKKKRLERLSFILTNKEDWIIQRTNLVYILFQHPLEWEDDALQRDHCLRIGFLLSRVVTLNWLPLASSWLFKIKLYNYFTCRILFHALESRVITITSSWHEIKGSTLP